MTKAKNADYGVATDGYLISRVNLNKDVYPNVQSRRDFYLELSKQLHDIPGITAESLTTSARVNSQLLISFLLKTEKMEVMVMSIIPW